MNFGVYVARRTLFALLAAYLVLTATFGVVALSPNTDLGAKLALMERGGASDEEVQAFVQDYEERRGTDDPLLVRYGDWLVDSTTLDWGYSFTYRRPVAAVMGDAIPRTALYVVPAILAALLVGTLLGGVAAELGGAWDAAVRVASYAAMGVPPFVAAYLVLHPFGGDVEWLRLLTWRGTPFYGMGYPTNPNDGLWPPGKPLRFLVPAAVFALALVGWQLRYVRNAFLDHRTDLATKLHRAKGASRWRTARHVLRNAAVPIVSASLSELLVIVLLGIYVVEAVFGIKGVAAVSMAAVRERDIPLILGSSMVLAFGGIVASYVQDLAYGFLDPRIGT